MIDGKSDGGANGGPGTAGFGVTGGALPPVPPWYTWVRVVTEGRPDRWALVKWPLGPGRPLVRGVSYDPWALAYRLNVLVEDT